MYMFDTNTVSHLFRQHPQVLNVMEKLPPSAVCISSVTEAELLYGVAKRRNKALQSMVEAFLAAVTVYAWDSEAARCYGEMRANMEKGQNHGRAGSTDRRSRAEPWRDAGDQRSRIRHGARVGG